MHNPPDYGTELPELKLCACVGRLSHIFHSCILATMAPGVPMPTPTPIPTPNAIFSPSPIPLDGFAADVDVALDEPGVDIAPNAFWELDSPVLVAGE